MKNLIMKLFGLSRESGLLLMAASVIVSVVCFVLSKGAAEQYSFIQNIQIIYLYSVKIGEYQCTGYGLDLSCGYDFSLKIYFGHALLLAGLGFLIGFNGYLKGESVKSVEIGHSKK